LTEILIVLEILDKTRDPIVFRSITPGTVRAETAKLIWLVVNRNLEAFRLEYPGQKPPKIKVLAMTPGDESSSRDEAILEIMKAKEALFPQYFST
jgi:hypothetical protein